jgi:hypothetical protein
LREALAANHDLLLDDDRREQKRRAGRGKAKKGLGARLFGGRRRAVVFLSLVALAAIGVPLNALYLQDGRHPAPLFQSAAMEPAQTERAPAAERAHVAAPAQPAHAREPVIEMAPPAMPTAHASSAHAAPAAKPAAGKAPVAKLAAGKPQAVISGAAKPVAGKPIAAKPPVVAHEAAHGAETRPAEKRGDTIGALISGKPQKPVEADKTVKSAQAALAKLGYPVQADGVMGAATKRALETFARANGLPADGAVSPAVLSKLRARVAAPTAPAAPPPPHAH